MAKYVDGFVLPLPKKNLDLASMMDPKAMPFDGMRLIYGGFKTLIEL